MHGQIHPTEHTQARDLLRSRKLNAIPAVEISIITRHMESKQQFRLPDGEGEFELRLKRRDIERSSLAEAVSYLLPQMIYPYSVHLPAYQLGDGETASDLAKALGTIIEAVDPKLFVLHVSKPPLKKWGAEMGAVLRDLPPDVVIALENVGVDKDKMRFPDRVPLVLDSIGAVPENLGFCLDVTHVIPRDQTKGTTEDKEGEIIANVFRFMDAMGARLRHMHLSNTRYEGEKRLQHLPLDDGILDFGRIKRELESRGFSGKCVLEFSHRRVAEGIETWNTL